MSRRKVMFIIPNLSGGGAEKVVLSLARHISRERFDLSLLIIDKTGPYLDEVPVGIPIHDLRCGRVRHALPRLVRLIRAMEPDVILSTLAHLNIALLMARRLLPPQTRLLVRETNTAVCALQEWKYPRAWTLLYRQLYPRADQVVCQSTHMRQEMSDHFCIPAHKLTTIRNPVDIIRISSMSAVQNPYPPATFPNIVWVGRLTPNKAPERIIEAMPKLLDRHPEARLWLLGEGPLEEQISVLSQRLGIQTRIHRMGFIANPYPWMHHADLMVLSSAYEGLPNVLLEAIACRCPVISLSHPGGTREVLELTGQPERYVAALTWDEWWFDRPPPDTLRSLEAHFGIRKIVGDYSDLLQYI